MNRTTTKRKMPERKPVTHEPMFVSRTADPAFVHVSRDAVPAATDSGGEPMPEPRPGEDLEGSTAEPYCMDQAVDESAEDEPVVVDEQLVDEQLVDEQLVVNEVVVDEQLVLTEVVVDGPLVTEVVVDGPLVDEQLVDEAVVNEAVVDEQLVDEQVEAATAEETSAEWPGGRAPEHSAGVESPIGPAPRRPPVSAGSPKPVVRVDTPGGSLRGRALVALLVALLILGAIGGAGGYLLAKRSESQYAARSEVLYHLLESQPTGFLREDRNLTTQVVTIKSRAVLAPIAARNEMTVSVLAERVSVQILEGTEIIRIQVRDPSPATAKRLVTQITDAFLDRSPTAASRRVAGFLDGQIRAMDDRITKLRQESESVISANPAVLGAILQDLLAQRNELVRQRNAIDVQTLTGPQVEALVPPYALEDAVAPKPARFAAGVALAAMLFGALGAMAVLGTRRRRALG